MKDSFGIRATIPALVFLCVCILLFVLIFIGYRISRSSTGVCEAEGRVLNSDEHRQATVRSLVGLELDNGRMQERKFHNGRVSVGIIRNSIESDFIHLLKGFSRNDDSFEKNFDINVISLREEAVKISDFRVPFTLVVYDTTRGGMATFTESEGVVRYLQFEAIEDLYKPTIFERYQGFGNYYYLVKQTIINRECCDNKKYSGAHEDYVSRKRRMYLDSFTSLERGWAVHSSIAVVSNCGEFLTVNDGSGSDARSIKWIRGE